MKQIFSLLLALLAFCPSFPLSQRSVRLFTLESGLKLYVLEDPTCATASATLLVDAGFKRQSERDAGFFALCARLKGADISADFASAARTFAPEDAGKAFKELSDVLKPMELSGAQWKAALDEAKRDVLNSASSVAGFINAAIDTKMFPESPWKSEGGASPDIFSQHSASEAKRVLESISSRCYTPERASLFVSGNMTEADALSLSKEFFTKPESDAEPAKENDVLAKEMLRKIGAGEFAVGKRFVLSDPELSADMTQIVVQYKDFSMDEADILAAVLNQDAGPYKKSAVAEPSLAIRGAEYINVASAQKSGSSRLIFQSLLEDTSQNPVAQAELFLEKIRGVSLAERDIAFASSRIQAEFDKICGSSASFMELLAHWHALKGETFPAESLFARMDSLRKTDASALQEKLSQAEPHVFVLVNSKVCDAHAKSFAEAGFSVLTRKNGAWHTQSAYKELVKSRAALEKAAERADGSASAAKRFVAANRSAFSSFTLSNGIPVTVKAAEGAKTAVISMTIAGGDLLFHETPGLASILTDCLAVNIRNRLDDLAMEGRIAGDCGVTAKTNATSSFLTVSCAADEIAQALGAISDVLIYSDISPALADGITFDERTQWRIKTGSMSFQLLCEAMRELYKGSAYLDLFKEGEDKPTTMEFIDIAQAYPTILDASRYSFIITGGVPDSALVKESLDDTFGVLGTHAKTKENGIALDAPAFGEEKARRIPLRHLFLTDIPAEKAGPKPAVLVPTTKFLDPVLYCLSAPESRGTDRALFNALLLEIARRMEEKIPSGETKVEAIFPDADYPFARILATNVERTGKIDAAYTASLKELRDALEAVSKEGGDERGGKSALLSGIENRWLLSALSQTATSEGTAGLIQIGLLDGNAQQYLDQYEAVDEADAEDYLRLLSAHFPDLPSLRVYSADSPK